MKAPRDATATSLVECLSRAQTPGPDERDACLDGLTDILQAQRGARDLSKTLLNAVREAQARGVRPEQAWLRLLQIAHGGSTRIVQRGSPMWTPPPDMPPPFVEAIENVRHELLSQVHHSRRQSKPTGEPMNAQIPTLVQRMRLDREVCTHPPTLRQIVPDPIDQREFLFFCMACGMMATEKQVGGRMEPTVPGETKGR